MDGCTFVSSKPENGGALEEDMIKLNIIKGVTINVLSEALQLNSDIRLEREITLIRQAEEVRSHEAIVRGSNKEFTPTTPSAKALQLNSDIRLEREITLIRQAEEVRSHEAIVRGSNKEFTPTTPSAITIHAIQIKQSSTPKLGLNRQGSQSATQDEVPHYFYLDAIDGSDHEPLLSVVKVNKKIPHVLRGAGGGTLNISGLFQAERHGHNATMNTFVETFTTSPLKTHKALLSGLFKMIEAYELQHLEENYPFAVSTSRRGIPGVVRFLTAEDIPGKNCFTPPLVFLFEQEEIFCSGKVLFAGQAVGLIVAETQQVANMAAQKVKIEYTNVKKPVILLREAAKSKDPNIVQLEKELKPKVVKANIKPRPRHRLRIRRSVVRKKSMLQYKIALATEFLSVNPYSVEVAQL
uniref:(California timema) hypothetical protein n=1 Tax=Timema californicum TaxID=61474 RepID=A0A7R9J195_TIMCA|nr:unnamed protein product [Timema californicum]